MYYNGGKVFLISFVTALLVSAVISVLFFLYIGPMLTGARAPARIEVPNVQGVELEQAKLMVQQKGLFLWVQEEQRNLNVPAGQIVSQDPLPGFPAEQGGLVKVVVSKGPEEMVIEGITVPDLLGIPFPQAKLELEKMKLKVGKVEKVTSDTIAEEHVVSMGFYPGTEVPEGTKIDLKVSSGATLVTVPRLFGKTLSQAERALEGSGLRIGQVRHVTDIEHRFGVVIGQNPRAGTRMKRGSGVDVSINTESGG